MIDDLLLAVGAAGYCLGLLLATLHPEPLANWIRGATIGWFLIFGFVWTLREPFDPREAPPTPPLGRGGEGRANPTEGPVGDVRPRT